MIRSAVAAVLSALLYLSPLVRARWAVPGVPNPDHFPDLEDVPDAGPVVRLESVQAVK